MGAGEDVLAVCGQPSDLGREGLEPFPVGLLGRVGCGSEYAHCYWLNGHCFDFAEQFVEAHGVESEDGLVCGVQ